jgi:hypothetical protein
MMAMLIFDFRLDVAFCLGFTLASTGPSIILPCLTKMIGMGYGQKRKVP